MTAKKILTVFGATGTQGGSVVKSILNDPKAASQYAIRAVTRDTTKPAAQKLAEAGAELVTVSLKFSVPLPYIAKEEALLTEVPFLGQLR